MVYRTLQIKAAGALASLLVGVISVTLLGCGSSAQNPASKEVRTPSVHAARSFVEARDFWAQTMSSELNPETRRRGFERSMAKLRDAALIEPKNPLIHSKIGDIQHSLGDVEGAMQSYTRACELVPDWSPAWLGFARCAIDLNRFDDARMALEVVKWSFESIAAWGAPEPPSFFDAFFSAFGISFPKTPPKRAIDDLSIEPQEAKQLVYAWMKESLDWSPDNAALLGGSAALARGELRRRLMARAELIQAQLIQAEGIVPKGSTVDAAVLATLDRSLDFDGDYFDARLLKAQFYLSAGNHDAARALIEPYFNEKNPMLAAHEELLMTSCHALTGVYLMKPSAESLARVQNFYGFLEKMHGPLQSASFWGLAQVWFQARREFDLERLEAVHRVYADMQGLDPEASRLVKAFGADLQRARAEAKLVASRSDQGTEVR
ncbi:MAG: hypothetical protein KDB53_01020 [Planctomycetes bacterium]|nr:hypothetical protein [Planctomycetota bacterium]